VKTHTGFIAAAVLVASTGCAPATAPMHATVPTPLAAEASVDTLAPGVTHRVIHRDEGPWAIHVVEVDPRACGVEFRTAKAGPGLEGVEPTSALGARTYAGRPALAAINADFFRARPFGVPEGPQVEAGEVVAAEGSYGPSVSVRFAIPQPVFGVTGEGRPFTAEATLAGSAWARHAPAYPLARVNAPPGPDSLALYNRFAGAATPADTGVVEVLLRVLTRGTAAGDTLRGVVLRIHTLQAGVALIPDGVVLSGRGRAAGWVRTLTAGDTVGWALPFVGAPGSVRELVGGFPLLLRSGEPVFHRVPTIRPAFATQRHPRSVVAIRVDGTVLLVAVDGRQPGYSVGMTLPELTELLLELGATDALNLDGGGSTTLVLRGRIVNRPSEASGERPVTNALLVLGPPPGDCHR
jgi:large repetitive protein